MEDDLLSLSERDTNFPSSSTLILVSIRTLIPILLNNAKRLPPSNTSVSHELGIATKVAKLVPIGVIKG